MIARYKAIAACILAAATFGCAGSIVGADASPNQSAVFDEVWQQFDLHYSFFQLKQINWDSLGAYYRPLALQAATDQEFASVISRMLRELRDVHVTLTPTGTRSTLTYASPMDTIPAYYNDNVVFQHYVTSSTLSATGHLRYGMLTASIGYIRIPSFGDAGWASEIDAALDQMRAATKIVVDVRNNYGGDYRLAADIAGRFADHSRTFGYLKYRNGPSHSDFTPYATETVSPSGPRQFTGPVYVLSNRRDFSSAEDFILAMRSLPNTTVVGDTTAGASGGPIVRELSNGWTYQLSEWIEYTSDKQTFEGVGLAPNYFARGTATDAQRFVDSAIDRALLLAQAR
jgi:hypothetical protein